MKSKPLFWLLQLSTQLPTLWNWLESTIRPPYMSPFCSKTLGLQDIHFRSTAPTIKVANLPDGHFNKCFDAMASMVDAPHQKILRLMRSVNACTNQLAISSELWPLWNRLMVCKTPTFLLTQRLQTVCSLLELQYMAHSKRRQVLSRSLAT